jgi:hypothetical protein
MDSDVYDGASSRPRWQEQRRKLNQVSTFAEQDLFGLYVNSGIPETACPLPPFLHLKAR